MDPLRFFLMSLRLVSRKTGAVLAYAELDAKRRSGVIAPTARLSKESSISNSGSKISIRIGEYSQIHAQLQTFGSGKIEIGEYCFIGPQTRIWSHMGISIGNRVLIAHGVNIIDSNSHSLSAHDRHQEYLSVIQLGQERLVGNLKMREIWIEDDAWIGYGASILKGVHIQKGAIVGANTVVTADVPAFTIVAGNPMRIIGSASV